MTLKERIENDYKKTFKEKNDIAVSALRMLKAAVKRAEINKRKDFDDNEVLEVVLKEVKQRRDSIEAFKNGNRLDLAQKEEAEIKVLEEYLPARLSAEELRDIIQEIIKEAKATSKKDFGRVMSLVIAKTRGQADGKMVSQIVNQELEKLTSS
jgi:hypothetical protein